MLVGAPTLFQVDYRKAFCSNGLRFHGQAAFRDEMPIGPLDGGALGRSQRDLLSWPYFSSSGVRERL